MFGIMVFGILRATSRRFFGAVGVSLRTISTMEKDKDESSLRKHLKQHSRMLQMVAICNDPRHGDFQCNNAMSLWNKIKGKGTQFKGPQPRESRCHFFPIHDRGSGGLCHNPATIPPNITAAEVAWLSSFDKEQSKHALVVAATIAAAADAVAAAHAADAVVRLASQNKENGAAMKIQTVFCGFLDMFDESRSGSTLQMPRRRLSTPFEAKNINGESAKIVEMDTYGRLKSSRSRRTNTWASDPCDDDPFEPPMLSSQASDWAQQHQHSKLSTTAQSTLRFANNSCGSNTPITPIAKMFVLIATIL
ncbi:hypothetical protein CQW23_32003 [Capsicum baccatum]|uniref:Arginyl tRNA synthetase N-terminal domain-containing protein n=1 Tax=Capsicum baccatum TaxID=33114 RepID=A0A2G2V643_CAPBA|nr:hypothetical protein CQW23_32003 [Capsicum baccatum]